MTSEILANGFIKILIALAIVASAGFLNYGGKLKVVSLLLFSTAILLMDCRVVKEFDGWKLDLGYSHVSKYSVRNFDSDYLNATEYIEAERIANFD